MLAHKKIKIAIADDHALFRKGISELLSDFDEIEILFDANNGAELTKKIETATVKPDVCLLDINMPIMDGFETAKEIKHKWPGIKMLAVSMYDQDFTIIRMLHSGATGYVLKDIEPEELKDAIVQVYNTGYYFSKAIDPGVIDAAQVQEEDEKYIPITDNENTFLKLCCSELTYKEIADRMGCSPRTVDGYRDKLFTKLHVTSRTGLAMYALREGIVSIFDVTR
ncbi:MAG: response regulator transcription factor [Sphingobacteriales bacterium]|nr:MAG: response regulator transcription factor [Sphingobacteriales bacterium]